MFRSRVIFIRHSASGPMLEAQSTGDADGSSAADFGGYKLGEQRNDQHRGAAAADGSQPRRAYRVSKGIKPDFDRHQPAPPPSTSER